MTSPRETSTKPRRSRGLASVADLVVDALRPAAKKRGFAGTDLFTHWPEIVGPVYRGVTQPERLSWPRKLADGGEDAFEPATLTVRCEGARALLFQHDVPQILERINAHFGYLAVARLRIVQKPIPRPVVPARPRLRPLSAAEEARLAGLVDGVEDDGLRRALTGLGRAVLATPRR